MSAKTRFTERIREHEQRVASARAAFDPPEDPPAEDRAMAFLREGAGPALALFVEARTGRHMVHFDPEAYAALESTVNDWLELYAACYGTEIDADFTLREAAQLLVDTHNIKDVAEVLTRVPEE